MDEGAVLLRRGGEDVGEVLVVEAPGEPSGAPSPRYRKQSTLSELICGSGFVCTLVKKEAGREAENEAESGPDDLWFFNPAALWFFALPASFSPSPPFKGRPSFDGPLSLPASFLADFPSNDGAYIGRWQMDNERWITPGKRSKLSMQRYIAV